jgi:hypothetical protein
VRRLALTPTSDRDCPTEFSWLDGLVRWQVRTEVRPYIFARGLAWASDLPSYLSKKNRNPVLKSSNFSGTTFYTFICRLWCQGLMLRLPRSVTSWVFVLWGIDVGK